MDPARAFDRKHKVPLLNYGPKDYQVTVYDFSMKPIKTILFKSYRNSLPERAKWILEKWFIDNIKNPYPNPEEKNYLLEQTELTRAQINNWLSSARKKYSTY